MDRVTAAWLNERGDLHDARVSSVHAERSTIQVALDDEWAAHRGISKPHGQEAPGTLVIRSFATVEGEPCDVNGGWLSEVRVEGDELSLVFSDKPALRFRKAEAWWRSA